jgi:hypothetical protein
MLGFRDILDKQDSYRELINLLKYFRNKFESMELTTKTLTISDGIVLIFELNEDTDSLNKIFQNIATIQEEFVPEKYFLRGGMAIGTIEENECRDAIVQKLKDKYEDIIVSREQQEANNRADINIKYKKDTNLEIQIECKRDDNSEIYIGIKEQLIDKYFATQVNYGIYLIFYFGDKKDMQKMIEKIKENISLEYENSVKIVLIDLKNKGVQKNDFI